MTRFASGGYIQSPGDRDDDRIPAFLSPGHQVTDPDEAEALGLTVDARRMREGKSGKPRLYAWRTSLRPTPERAAAGCPATGWIHEGEPPWRVLTWPDLESARQGVPANCWADEYTGSEDTVLFADVLGAIRPV